MPIPASGQTIDGVIEGIFAMLASLFGLTEDPGLGTWNGAYNNMQVHACEGPPGSYQPDIIIALDPLGDGFTQTITRPTMGTNRSREIQAEMKLVFSVYVPGADIAKRTARQTVNAMAEAVQLYFRVAPQETLGGACREAFAAPTIDGPHIVPQSDVETEAVIGYSAFSSLTITAFIRN